MTAREPWWILLICSAYLLTEHIDRSSPFFAPTTRETETFQFYVRLIGDSKSSNFERGHASHLTSRTLYHGVEL